jgi:chromosome segregation ATPase
VSRKSLPENRNPASATRSQAASEGNLWVAQERLWQNERQSAEQAVALVERDQRISALQAERDWLSSQLEEERQRSAALEPELDLARGGWAAAEKRVGELEAGYHQASTRLKEAEISVSELSHQLEIVKTERSDAVLELANHQETFAEINLQLNKARDERIEMEQILGRARADLDRATHEQAAAELIAEECTSRTEQLNATIARLRSELGAVSAERDKLQSVVSEDHDLAEYAEMKSQRDQLEIELRESQSRLDAFREKANELTLERDALKRERTDLQLKVAALRDAHDDTQLQQDNEVLRRMVERLNEALKEARPEITKRRLRDSSGGVVGGLARAVASRVFVPDPDIAGR